MAFTFTGHDTFTCRNYWLKKGLDHIWSGKKFDNQAIKDLGVGKNMVGSIRYWLRSFGLVDSSEINKNIAQLIFHEVEGKDPYLEDMGSIWLLHFLLVTSEKASIYSLVFNHFRKEKMDFNREQLQSFVETKCQSKGFNYNSNSIKRDIGVFINNYRLANSKSIEDDFMGLLHELEIVDLSFKTGNQEIYKIDNKNRPTLPAEIILACVIKQMNGNSISFHEMLTGINQVGSVFAISNNYLLNRIEQCLEIYPKHLTYTDDGGVQVFQIIKKLDVIDVLNKYYGK